MNIENIPESLHHLIPLAQKWGIGDDYERDLLVSNATRQELETLVSSISDKDAEEIDNWLAGPESDGPKFSKEYITFSCFFLAFEYARIKLENGK